MTTILGNPTQVLDKMPGVESGDLMSSGLADRLSVRGGSDAETIAYYGGFYIIRPFHAMFGDSIFMNETVGDITLYKGITPVRYGQNLSGVMELDPAVSESGFHGKTHSLSNH